MLLLCQCQAIMVKATADSGESASPYHEEMAPRQGCSSASCHRPLLFPSSFSASLGGYRCCSQLNGSAGAGLSTDRWPRHILHHCQLMDMGQVFHIADPCFERDVQHTAKVLRGMRKAVWTQAVRRVLSTKPLFGQRHWRRQSGWRLRVYMWTYTNIALCC